MEKPLRACKDVATCLTECALMTEGVAREEARIDHDNGFFFVSGNGMNRNVRLHASTIGNE